MVCDVVFYILFEIKYMALLQDKDSTMMYQEVDRIMRTLGSHASKEMWIPEDQSCVFFHKMEL